MSIQKAIAFLTLPFAPNLFVLALLVDVRLLFKLSALLVYLIPPLDIKRCDQIWINIIIQFSLSILEAFYIFALLRLRVCKDFIYTHTCNHHYGIADDIVLGSHNQHFRVSWAQRYLRK